MNSKKYLLLFILTFSLIFFLKGKGTFVPAEDISIISSFGVDLLKTGGKEPVYSASLAVYNFGTSPEIKTLVLTGSGGTLGQTVISNQLKLDKKLLIGSEKTFTVSVEAAKQGIMPIMDLLFENTNVNDNAFFIVNGGKPQDLMNFKFDGFPNSSDYLENLIRHSIEQNFFPKKYRLRNAYRYLINEGNNLTVPYVEIKGNNLAITGMALFKGDKMIKKIGIKESKALNILRENNIRGTISIKKNLKEYLDVYINSKKKVKIDREKEKYKFDINLDIEGYIISNMMYDNFLNNPEGIKIVEKNVKDEVERMTRDFIYKMQNDYKIDLVNLGEHAAAKYGRDKGIDWNEVVSNSDISVNVKVKVSIRTRGMLK
jgi:Ger(x)C family germination protein